jgi:flavorubredoxin
MPEAIIIYESKYGNTRQVAELIAEGMKQVRGIEVTLTEVGQVDLNNLATFDAFLIGSPNHMGGPTRGIKKLIDHLNKLDLGKKKIAVFDTYMSKDFEKAIKKMEKQVVEEAFGLAIAAPGLSVRVDGMKGPITQSELNKCREFGVKIANGL